MASRSNEEAGKEALGNALSETGAGNPADAVANCYSDLLRTARYLSAKEAGADAPTPSDLVHEVYLKLARYKAEFPIDKVAFFALAARMMRHIIVDYARKHTHRHAFEPEEVHPKRDLHPDPSLMIALDNAMKKLEDTAPRTSKVVELSYFIGMTNQEIASQLGISVATVKRDLYFPTLIPS